MFSVLKQKRLIKKGTGFIYLKAENKKGEKFSGYRFFILGIKVLFIANSECGWRDEKGNKMHFKFRKKTLYIKRFSISL